MAFVDTGVSAYGGLNPGAPSGGGVGVNANASAVGSIAPGANGMGSGWSIKSWTILYILLIASILTLTGVLFNGKGKG